MAEASTFERVRAVVMETYGAEEDEVTSETAFIADLGGESIDQPDLVFRLEREFDLEIPSGDVAEFETVQQHVEYIDGRL